MATVSYSYITIRPDFVAASGAGDQISPAVVLRADGGINLTYAYDIDPNTDDVGLNFYSQNLALLGTTILLFAGNQGAPQVAGTSNGSFAWAFQDDYIPPGSDRGSTVILRLSGTNLRAGDETDDQRNPVVAGLTGDRTVVVYEDKSNGSSDIDIKLSVYKNDGTLAIKDGAVAAGSNDVESKPTVAALQTSGGFVVGWERRVSSDSHVLARRYNSEGNALGSAFTIDSVGLNTRCTLVGLADGGFAAVYEDNEYGLFRGISLRIYNANGSPPTDVLLVDAPPAGSNATPTVTQLANGFITVSWAHYATNNTDLYMRTFTAHGRSGHRKISLSGDRRRCDLAVRSDAGCAFRRHDLLRVDRRRSP